VGIGAKDQSNHRVAGSLRSFPQDSWSLFKSDIYVFELVIECLNESLERGWCRLLTRGLVGRNLFVPVLSLAKDKDASMEPSYGVVSFILLCQKAR